MNKMLKILFVGFSFALMTGLSLQAQDTIESTLTPEQKMKIFTSDLQTAASRIPISLDETVLRNLALKLANMEDYIWEAFCTRDNANADNLGLTIKGDNGIAKVVTWSCTTKLLPKPIIYTVKKTDTHTAMGQWDVKYYVSQPQSP